MQLDIHAISVEYPGVLQWLRHGELEGFWSLQVLREGEQEEPPEADVYLLGAWHQAYEGVVSFLKEKYPASRVIVAWSSSAGEIDGAPVEIMYAGAMKRNLDGVDVKQIIDGVGCLHPGLVHLFGEKGFYLPAPVHVPKMPSESHPSSERSGIGFYAPATLKKNAVSQILGVLDLQQRARPEDVDALTLFTNLERYEPALKHWGVRYVIESWVDSREEHLARLAKRRVVLCASTAESWCYGAVDALSVGTPVLGSPTVGWLPKDWRVADPNDPLDVALVLRRMLEQDQVELGRRAWSVLVETAVRQNDAVRAALGALPGQLRPD